MTYDYCARDFDYEDERDEQRAKRRIRNRYNCTDGMCGATDCQTCHGVDAWLDDEDYE